MANVDLCVRYAELGLCSNTFINAKKIFELDNKNKVKIFRNKTLKEVEDILLNCSKNIKIYINNNYYNGKNNNILLNHENNNNKVGADLLHILPSNKIISIELKFGEETDKNIGMDKFNKIFSCDIFSKILSVEKRKKWIDLYFNKENMDENKQFKRLFNDLNNGIKIFNDFNKNKNWTLTKEEQDFMEENIINVSGDGKTKYDYYIKFLLNDSDFSSFSHITTGIGQWIIQEVDYLSNDIKRVNVFVRNYDTNVEIKYTLNWKNNYKYKNIVAKAKLGFGSSSWNVWIDVNVKKI